MTDKSQSRVIRCHIPVSATASTGICDIVSPSTEICQSGSNTGTWFYYSSMCALWPWPWRNDLGSRSWHTLKPWTTIVWNYVQIGQGSTKLWPGHDVNRRTDRQTDGRTDRQGDSYIPPPQTLLAGGGGINITRHVFVKHAYPRQQQSQNLAKISKSYILTPPHPQGHVMSVKYEEPIDELAIQVWLLYHHPDFKYCTLFVSGTELRTDKRTETQTNRRTDNPNTRCPRRTFQVRGIKTINISTVGAITCM